jgi:glycosyltransferase involved in cell wall biosynthesis
MEKKTLIRNKVYWDGVQDASEFCSDVMSSRPFLLKQLYNRATKGKAEAAKAARQLLHDRFLGPQIPASTEKGLALYGLFKAEIGIGQSARQSAQALSTTKYPASRHLIALPNFRNEIEFDCTEDCYSPYDTAVIFINPPELIHLGRGHLVRPSYITGKRRIAYWAWELPVFPAVWAPALDLVDEIWVPSRFVHDSISTATDKPIRIIPHAVPVPNRSKTEARQQFGLDPAEFIFLSAFDTNSFLARKNPVGAIRAFRHAFPKRNSQVRLILKCHGMTRRNGFEQLRSEIANDERITVIDEVMSPERMQLLHAACNAYVSLHRSEGFGLNIAEAMAAGALAIATNFSGNIDFMNTDNSILIPYKMCAVGEGEYLCGKGQWWAEPDHDFAVEALRMAVERDATNKGLRDQAREDIERNHSYHRVGDLFVRAARADLPIGVLERV